MGLFMFIRCKFYVRILTKNHYHRQCNHSSRHIPEMLAYNFSGGSVVMNLPANAGDVGDMNLIPGWGEEGNGNPL